MEDTIVAPATPLGRGGISVIRVSGVGAKKSGEFVCGELNEPWVFKACRIKNKKGSVVDSGLVVFFKSPRSYTGEDVVEVHCHGSPVVVDVVMSVFVFHLDMIVDQDVVLIRKMMILEKRKI